MIIRTLVVGFAATAVLAGCGGGGGGSSTTSSASSTTSSTPSSLTVNTDNSVTSVTATPVPTASNPNPTTCDAGTSTTPGQFVLPITDCGNQTLTIRTNTGQVNTYVPGQSTTVTVNSGTTTDLQKFAGIWTVSYTSTLAGGDQGTCSSIQINASGQITASSCVSSLSSQTFTLTGGLDSAGDFRGAATTGAVYSGTFVSGGPSSGTWTNSSTGGQGTWTATGPT